MELINIKPDKNQPRKTFDEEKLKFLAESILSNGLLKPIEVDENGVIIDGERRWRACKIAKLKDVEVRVIKKKASKKERLRWQLVADIQDEEIPTEERYEAIVKLWKMEGSPSSKDDGIKDWCKTLGINRNTLERARNWVQDKEEKPEEVEGFSAGIWREVRTLPKEERDEIRKKIKDDKEPFVKLVEKAKEEIRTERRIEELDKQVEESKKSQDNKIKIKRTEEMLDDIKSRIDNEFQRINKLMFIIGRIRRTKLYMHKPKEKQDFFRYIDGRIKEMENWLKDLKNLRENLELEVVST